MKKAKSRLTGLRALNDIYIIEEDPVSTVVETDSGLTPDVVDAVKSGMIILPDKFDSFANKFPCTGKIISKGEKCCYPLKVGSRVGYARLGVQRYKLDGKTLCDVRESDLHYEIVS